MKKSILLYILSVLLIFASCNSEQKENESVNETPEVFQEKRIAGDVSFSKRGYYDLVEELYQEILKNNAEIKEIDNKIKKLERDTEAATKEMNKYFENNHGYYSSAKSNIQYIEDSLLRLKIDTLITSSKNAFEKETISLQTLKDTLDRKKTEQNDQFTAMKIVISLIKIENYQNNEMPVFNESENLLKRYEALINEIKKIIKN